MEPANPNLSCSNRFLWQMCRVLARIEFTVGNTPPIFVVACRFHAFRAKTLLLVGALGTRQAQSRPGFTVILRRLPGVILRYASALSLRNRLKRRSGGAYRGFGRPRRRLGARGEREGERRRQDPCPDTRAAWTAEAGGSLRGCGLGGGGGPTPPAFFLGSPDKPPSGGFVTKQRPTVAWDATGFPAPSSDNSKDTQAWSRRTPTCRALIDSSGKCVEC